MALDFHHLCPEIWVSEDTGLKALQIAFSRYHFVAPTRFRRRVVTGRPSNGGVGVTGSLAVEVAAEPMLVTFALRR